MIVRAFGKTTAEARAAAQTRAAELTLGDPATWVTWGEEYEVHEGFITNKPVLCLLEMQKLLTDRT